MKFSVDIELGPKFMPGDKVWYIHGRKVVESRIQSVIFELIGEKGGEPVLCCVAYKIDVFNRHSWRGDGSFRGCELYEDKKTALEQAAWHEVVGISRKEWKKAIGNEKKFAGKGELEIFEASNDSRTVDLLSKCRIDGGLVENDVRFLEGLIHLKSIGGLPKKGCPLDRILSQLGIVVKVNV